ncbi:hypothetical protein C8Q74DRAFT_1320310 [Fomes fomentarius]|nr:hypothetical protein C8Q74DRAFT_1320310 [Fomes fomentarius]
MPLTYDVLYAIMEIQSQNPDVPTLSSMSQTCHVLRNAGVKHLLDRPIILRNDRDTYSFSLFMKADGARRFPLLRRSLAIVTGTLPPHVAAALVKLVCDISHLERLVLHRADELFASDAGLSRAFAGLTCLRHIVFSAADETSNMDCTSFFKRMQSPLITASLHLPSSTRRWFNGRQTVALADPAGLLRNSAKSLEELSGTNFETRRHSTVYPAVKRLRIQFSLLPDISPYLGSFPNVRVLDVTSSVAFDCSTLQSLCLMNEDVQARLGCWPELEELGGDLSDLYAVSLRARVTLLRVSVLRGREYMRYLADVLSRAHPSRLQLEVDFAALRAEGDDALATIFGRSEAATYVRELDLRIVLEGMTATRTSDLDMCFARVVDVIESLPLTVFKVQIGPEAVRRSAPRAEPEDLLWDAAHHVDRVRQVCPSLRQLVVGCTLGSDSDPVLKMSFE